MSKKNIITRQMHGAIDGKDGCVYDMQIEININYLLCCEPTRRAFVRAVRGNGRATCLGDAVKIMAMPTGKTDRRWCGK